MGMLIRMKGVFQLLALLGKKKSKIKVIYKKVLEGLHAAWGLCQGTDFLHQLSSFQAFFLVCSSLLSSPLCLLSSPTWSGQQSLGPVKLVLGKS